MNKDERLKMAFNTLRSAGQIKTQRDFAALIGYNETNVSRALKGDGRYLTGAIVERAEEAVGKLVGNVDEPTKSILVIPYGARGGTIGDFLDGVHEYDCERITSPIKGADYAMEVTGDSMSPEYPSGSRVLIKKIDETQFIAWNETYVLDTPNGAVIKRIRKTEDPAMVECVSVNPAYQPYTIQRDFIRGWYRVLMVMSLK